MAAAWIFHHPSARRHVPHAERPGTSDTRLPRNAPRRASALPLAFAREMSEHAAPQLNISRAGSRRSGGAG